MPLVGLQSSAIGGLAPHGHWWECNPLPLVAGYPIAISGFRFCDFVVFMISEGVLNVFDVLFVIA